MRAPPAERPRTALTPRASVLLELARAFAGAVLLPLHLVDFLFRRESLALEVAAELERPAPAPWEPPHVGALPDRPLRVFVSCAETSGEIHAANLVRRLLELVAAAGAPPPELVGLGGARLRAAGVRTLADPVANATMGFSRALRRLPYYVDLLHGAARELQRCDVAVLVDSPALHVPLGRIARRAGAQVVHFVTPQYWGWAPWRAGGYRRAVDRALTILPFEPGWFARRGIESLHVGHPLLDALPPDPPAPDAPGRTALALLPGSRRGVIERNLPWMLTALSRLRAAQPGLEVLLPHPDPDLAPRIRELVRAARAEDWVRLVDGDLHGALARCRAAFSVSGTVLIDLLHQRLPAVVVYRLGSALSERLYRQLVVVPWFASVNLLAGSAVLPERAFHGDGPLDEVVAALDRALRDDAWRARCLRGLELAAGRLGPPGACGRAAAAVLERAAGGPA